MSVTDTAIFGILVTENVNHTSVFDELNAQWGPTEFSPLSVFLASTIAVARIHSTNHWQASQDSFYGDHLMFERLYQSTNDEIDSIAERVVGLGGMKLVDRLIQEAQVFRLMTLYSAGQSVSMPKPNDLVKSSLVAEMHHLKMLEICAQQLGSALTRGSENMLDDVADSHETNLYLLRARLVKVEQNG